MIWMFNRRELLTLLDTGRYMDIKQCLRLAEIPHYTKYPNSSGAGRHGRGMANHQQICPIYVHKKTMTGCWRPSGRFFATAERRKAKVFQEGARKGTSSFFISASCGGIVKMKHKCDGNRLFVLPFQQKRV